MTAAPAEGPAAGPVGSLEVRWIVPGQLPPAMLEWFARFGLSGWLMEPSGCGGLPLPDEAAGDLVRHRMPHIAGPRLVRCRTIVLSFPGLEGGWIWDLCRAGKDRWACRCCLAWRMLTS